MSASESKRLGLLMRQAKIIREAYEAGHISRVEHDDWLDDLRRPRGLREFLSWHLFAVRP